MAFAQDHGRLDLKRRLKWYQIFFISIGGVIGIGFFRGSSTTLGVSGPVGALVAVVLVGLLATAVMEGMCHFIILWPIPNAMVEYVKAFIDEDLGIAIGLAYWYLYCVTFSALTIAAVELTNYWHIEWVFKALIYVFMPLVLLIINALPIQYFGWIEFVGVHPIGDTYFEDGVTNDPNVASSHAIAVFESIPLATFAYIGVELISMTAFEALDPRELKLPARNIGWFMTVLYAIATGSFVANVSWQDQNLPRLFNQALVMVRNPDLEVILPNGPFTSTGAAPLIALYRAGFRFLPSFLNGCFIYSAFSCANTALYVASRQLHGLTRSISVDTNSNVLRKFLAWTSGVDHRTRSPWPALVISALALCWLPFIRLHHSNDLFLEDVQAALMNIGSVSCILVWASQCAAYISFVHYRSKHINEIRARNVRWAKLIDPSYTGWFEIAQPGLAWFGLVGTLAVVFVLNSVGLWGGQRLSVKAVSAYVSPALITACVLCIKIWGLRARGRGRWIGRRVGVDLRQWVDFERRLIRLEDLIYPVERSGRGKTERGREAPSEYGGGSVWGGGATTTTTRRSSVETTQVGRYNRSNLVLVNNVDPPMQRSNSVGQHSGAGSAEPLVDGWHEGIPMRDRRFLSPESTVGSRDGIGAGSEASIRQNY